MKRLICGFALCASQVLSEIVKTNPACYRKDPKLAGVEIGTQVNDIPRLFEVMETDMRMWGFQICINEQTNVLSSFRIETAKDYGAADYVDMTPIGPGTKNCRRYRIADPINEWVSRIELHTS